VGLLPYWRIGPLYNGMLAASDWVESLLGTRSRIKDYAPQSSRSVPNADPGNGDYSGVILLPEAGPQTVMLAPRPPDLLPGSSPILPAKPLSIPFRCTFWFCYPARA